MPLTRRTLLHIGAAGTLGLAGCIGTSGSGGPSNGRQGVEDTSQVSMTGSQFQPRNIHVDVGTTVTWTNDDTTEHTVTSASDNWNLDKSVPGGESVEHTFEEDGIYDVYCTLHGNRDLTGMSMKVGVGDAMIETPLGSGDGSGDGGDGGYY